MFFALRRDVCFLDLLHPRGSAPRAQMQGKNMELMNYDVREKIGEGGFGLICRAVSTAGSKSTQGVERALKYVRKGAVDEARAGPPGGGREGATR